jgi:arsenate reductase (thioredoxin)
VKVTGRKIRVLYLCTGNTCRSQMAEGYTEALAGDTFEAYSAGVKAQDRIDPMAIQVMKEDGVDISNQHPKTLDELKDVEMDLVVTVCDNANETCPIFPGSTKMIHHSFDDPPKLARNLNPEEAMEVYRRVRDEIKSFVYALPQQIVTSK